MQFPSPYVIPGIKVNQLSYYQKSILKSKYKRIEALEEILEIVCDFYGELPKDVKGKSRRRRLCLTRHSFFYIACRYSIYNLGEIGKFCGGKDHSSVIHGKDAVKNLIQTDSLFRGQFENLELQFKKPQVSIQENN